MGRNTMGGKHHKRGKNSNGDKTRKIIYADNENTLYGLVVSSLGDCRFLIHCSDRVDRIGLIRGALYKKGFINPEDVVLVSLRTFETIKDGVKEKCDIIMSYNSHEIDQLKSSGLYYKNTNTPFTTVLENGKPAQMLQTDDVFKFTNSKDDDIVLDMKSQKKNPIKEESDDDSDVYKDDEVDYSKPSTFKVSNVKVIDSNDNTPFNFDDI